MPWLRVDDRMYCNRKVIKSSMAGKCFWIWGMDYSSDQLTDGVLEPSELQMLAGMLQIPNWQEVAAELVDVGLFENGPNGTYIIHDYLKYNPSRQEVLEEREKNATRQAEWQAKRKERQETPNPLPNDVTNPVSKPCPVPVPVPIDNKNGANAPTLSRAKEAKKEREDVIERLARAYCVGMGWKPDEIGNSERKKWGPALLDMFKMGLDPPELTDCVMYMRQSDGYWKNGVPPPSSIVTYYKEWERKGKPRVGNGSVNLLSPSMQERAEWITRDMERSRNERKAATT